MIMQAWRTVQSANEVASDKMIRAMHDKCSESQRQPNKIIIYVHSPNYPHHQGPLLLTQINFYPSMDK